MDAGGKLAECLKALRAIPQFYFASQIGLADVAIIILFAFGGFAGFPGFAKYADIKTLIANLDHKQAWAAFLFIFNFLLIYRKIAKPYLVAWLAVIHALIADAAIAGLCVLVAKPSIFHATGWLNTVVGVQAGLAAVYLVVQGWIDFKPDIRSLAIIFDDLEKSASRVESLGKNLVENKDVKEVADLCDKFLNDVDVALLEARHVESSRAALAARKQRVETIYAALKGPLVEVPDALHRARTAE